MQNDTIKPEKPAIASREPRTSVVAGWRPELVRRAEQQCAVGIYTLAADLCESTFCDDRVSKCVDSLYAATTLPLKFTLPGNNDEKSKADPVCVALATDWWKIFPEQTLKQIIQWISLFNLCLVHIDRWDIDTETGRVLPVLSVWHCRNLKNDPDHGWQALVATPSNPYGEWVSIEPGNGEWALFESGAGPRAPLRSPLFGIANWFLLGKLYSPIDWASQSERHGQGREYITNTMSGSGEDPDTGAKLDPRAREELAQKHSKMGRNGVSVLPRGWVPQLITDGANAFETFPKQTDYANSVIMISLLGTNLTTEVKEGSFAAAKVHKSVDAVKMRGLLEWLSTVAREQILKWWHRFNFGKGPVPYPEWDTTPPEDKKAVEESRSANANALKTYREAGAQLNQKAWFEGRVELLPTASEAFPEKPAQTASAPAKQASQKQAMTLAQAKEPETAFDRGRDYIDRLESKCCGIAAKKLAPTVASIISAIEGAEDYEDALARVKEAYQGAATPSALVKATEAALILAELAGAETVDQEFETEE